MNVPAGSVTASAATSSAEANARFGERLAREIEGVLGVGIAADALDVEGDGNQSATIGAMCLVDGQPRVLTGHGASLLEASRDLIRAAAELRLAAAWWRIVGPT